MPRCDHCQIESVYHARVWKRSGLLSTRKLHACKEHVSKLKTALTSTVRPW